MPTVVNATNVEKPALVAHALIAEHIDTKLKEKISQDNQFTTHSRNIKKKITSL
jgi:hypothetical protein